MSRARPQITTASAIHGCASPVPSCQISAPAPTAAAPAAAVIDGAGKLAYVHRGYAGSTFRTTDELIEAIRAASAAARG